MSYPDDPRDLSALGKKKTSGYSSEYEQEKVPTPYDPNPAPLPDVRPPGQNQQQQPTQQQQPGNLPAPRQQAQPQQQLTPEQIQARNQAAAVQQAGIEANNISLAPVGTTVAAAAAPVAQQQTQQPQVRQRQAAVPQQPAAVEKKPQAQQPPAAQKQPVQTQAPAANRVLVDEPEKPKIDRSKIEFLSGSEQDGVSAKDKLLNTEGLVKIYDGRKVVKGVDINVGKGEIVGLLGPNGAGKTTSFYMIVGLVPPNDGTVMFNGVNVTKMPMYKRARLGMGYLPQEESHFRKLTVEENIMAVMQTMKYSRKEKKARCEELLERFSITHIRKNLAMACSGGEKRRLTIARSLVPDPTLIMLDEPFAGVDPIAVAEIQGIVEDLRQDGLAILLTDHSARETLQLVDRAYLIYEGSVLREGSRDFLANDPVSKELYLGDHFSM